MSEIWKKELGIVSEYNMVSLAPVSKMKDISSLHFKIRRSLSIKFVSMICFVFRKQHTMRILITLANNRNLFIFRLLLMLQLHYSPSLNSNISPGWQFSSRQMASRVEKRTALAFPVFKMERLAGVRSIRSASSLSEIFRFAIMTSRFTMIGIS